jgi:hypothetical protein
MAADRWLDAGLGEALGVFYEDVLDASIAQTRGARHGGVIQTKWPPAIPGRFTIF